MPRVPEPYEKTWENGFHFQIVEQIPEFNILKKNESWQHVHIHVI